MKTLRFQQCRAKCFDSPLETTYGGLTTSSATKCMTRSRAPKDLSPGPDHPHPQLEWRYPTSRVRRSGKVRPIRIGTTSQQPEQRGESRDDGVCIKRRPTRTSPKPCTHYSVSLTCTVHFTSYTYCTLYTYMFPVSIFPMLRFHLLHLFHLVTFTYWLSHLLTKHRLH
jgi:hypothetical protein